MTQNMFTKEVNQRFFPLEHGNRHVLTGPISLGIKVKPMELRPTDEPIFYKMTAEWGYEPIDIPWTGERISEGRVLSDNEV